jgi:hypothetical protein
VEAWLATLVYQVGNVTFSVDAPQSAIGEITRRHIHLAFLARYCAADHDLSWRLASYWGSRPIQTSYIIENKVKKLHHYEYLASTQPPFP